MEKIFDTSKTKQGKIAFLSVCQWILIFSRPFKLKQIVEPDEPKIFDKDFNWFSLKSFYSKFHSGSGYLISKNLEVLRLF